MADITGNETYPGEAVHEVRASLRAVQLETSRREAKDYIGALVVVPVTPGEPNPTPYAAVSDILTSIEQTEGSLFIPETTSLVISGIKRARLINTGKSKAKIDGIRRVQGMFLQFGISKGYANSHTRADFPTKRHPDIGDVVGRLRLDEEALASIYGDDKHFCHIALTDPAQMSGFGIDNDKTPASAYMLSDIHIRQSPPMLVPTWAPISEL